MDYKQVLEVQIERLQKTQELFMTEAYLHTANVTAISLAVLDIVKELKEIT